MVIIAADTNMPHQQVIEGSISIHKILERGDLIKDIKDSDYVIYSHNLEVMETEDYKQIVSFYQESPDNSHLRKKVTVVTRLESTDKNSTNIPAGTQSIIIGDFFKDAVKISTSIGYTIRLEEKGHVITHVHEDFIVMTFVGEKSQFITLRIKTE